MELAVKHLTPDRLLESCKAATVAVMDVNRMHQGYEDNALRTDE
ncbi:MAG TPA: hypothetical protein VF808_10425 [Ktedonobacterales bacterium]